MSYVKQTWTSNDVITASKLNHIETGIEDASGSGGGIPVITIDTTQSAVHASTYNVYFPVLSSQQSIVQNAFDNNQPLMLKFTQSSMFITSLLNTSANCIYPAYGEATKEICHSGYQLANYDGWTLAGGLIPALYYQPSISMWTNNLYID